MPNFYTTREAVKRAASIKGADQDEAVDRLIESASRAIDKATRRIFIPKTQTRLYRWPARNQSGTVLWLDFDLLSVSALLSEAQDSSPTTIVSTDYFLEPANEGPPYNRIEIDLSSSAAFQSGATPQRSISVAGSWGYCNTTRSAGTVSSGLAASAAAVSMVCSNAALIGVGDTLLIETEQVFVSERSFAALGSVLVNDAGITANMADDTVTVDASHGINAREVIRLDSEEMFVRSVSGNVLHVIRQWNGTTLAAHNDDTAVHINRTLTLERGVNGTTAVTHADGTAISKYLPPADIQELCLAEAVAAYHQEGAGWGRVVGSGEGARELSGRDLRRLREDTIKLYRRNAARSEAV